MSTYQTQGLVLSHHDFREADKIFSIYTETHGKIEVLAAGSRKIKSKLRAHLEPFSVVDLMVAHGRQFDRLASAISQKSYNKIKENYNLLIVNYQLLEIVDQLTKLHHPDRRVFNLLENVFERLDAFWAEPENWQSIYTYFVLNFLAISGYRPEFKICLRCRNQVDNPRYFNHQDGSVICGRCVDRADNDELIVKKSVETLSAYLVADFSTELEPISFEAYHLMQNFLFRHLDRPLQSQMVLA